MHFKCLILLFVSLTVLSSDFTEETITIDGVERSYVTKFPDNHQSDIKLPVIIALHGGGSTWEKFNKGTTKRTLELYSNKNNMLLIFPQGKSNHWNDGRLKNLKDSDSLDDVKFISKLIDKSIEKHHVDSSKVFITGMSNGGFMAIRLGIELSDKVKAIAAVSAQMSVANQDLNIQKPISFLLINGTDDPVVPYHGGEMKLFKFSKSRGTILSTTQTINYFLNANNCHPKPIKIFKNKRKFDKTSIISNHYEKCESNTQVKLLTVNGGGHTWPGGKQYLPIAIIGRLSREINASQSIVDFFLNL